MIKRLKIVIMKQKQILINRIKNKIKKFLKIKKYNPLFQKTKIYKLIKLIIIL